MPGSTTIRRSLASLAGLAIVAATLSASVADPSAAPGEPVVKPAAAFDTSTPLKAIDPKQVPASATAEQDRLPASPGRSTVDKTADTGSAAVQDHAAANMPETGKDFAGVASTSGDAAPDISGDVGPDHYLQYGSDSFAVWDKEGKPLYGPVGGNTLFSGFGGTCENGNGGSPTVLYDEQADRWMASQSAIQPDSGVGHQCVAVSATADPLGAWHRYDFEYPADAIGDSAKFGIWPDGYYMTTNEFDRGTSEFLGAGAVVYQREQMLAGAPANQIYFHVDSAYGGLLPADAEGQSPPDGSPNPVTAMSDDAWGGVQQDTLHVWNFKADWNIPGNSSFGDELSPDQNIVTKSFDSDLCQYKRDCLPQQGSDVGQDPASDRLTSRAGYRNLGDHQAIVLNQTVDADGTDHAGLRWYELRNSGDDWSIHQQSTFAPDQDNRSTGSIGMDVSGNIAVGYTVANTNRYSSLGYAGRLADDPSGELAQGEAVMAEGTASGPSGGYSSISVDPTDGCTFWYTGESAPEAGKAGSSTRVGSFRFGSCLEDATGVASGVVFDGKTGKPLAGAKVSGPDGASTVSDGTGAYTLRLPVGTHELNSTGFGYKRVTRSVEITEEGKTKADFTLPRAPHATLSGKVTDASGHGWPVYSAVAIEGLPEPVFTDPVTGEYEIEVPEGSYALTATAEYPGYIPRTETIEVDGNTEVDFALSVTPDCIASGYAPNFDDVQLSEPFDSGAPSGWDVVNNDGALPWSFDDPGERGNLTGGEGGFAIADSDYPGRNTIVDTDLVSPAMDLSSLGSPTVKFKTDYRSTNDDVARVEISGPDDTWTTIWDSSGISARNQQVEIPLLPSLKKSELNASDVRLRFHYHGEYAWWWQLDDVQVGDGGCKVNQGGRVVGQVTDSQSGKALDNAKVSDSVSGESGTSGSTPADPSIGDGFYALFTTTTGKHNLVASKSKYASATKAVDVKKDNVVWADFALGAGHFEVTPGEIDANVTLGGSWTQKLTVTNTGDAKATLDIKEAEGGFDPMAADNGAARMVKPVQGKPSTGMLTKGDAKSGATAAKPSAAAEWGALPDFPTDISSNAAARGEDAIYVVGGFDGNETTAASFKYDIVNGGWSEIAPLPTPLQKPAAAFIDDVLYVYGGWNPDGSTSTSLFKYDPAGDSWSQGAEGLTGVSAPGQAVVDGTLYIMGGCRDSVCTQTDAVQSYDTASDSWTAEAAYPAQVSWASCGGLADTVVCAGGTNDDGGLTNVYTLSPGADEWSPGASMPIDLWGSAYDVANGMLVVNGGITGGSSVTNATYGYDLTADAWVALPNSSQVRFRAAGACGFARIGGSDEATLPSNDAELLSEFDDCGGGTSDISWLKPSKTSVTLNAGASTTVDITMSATVADGVEQPGTYTAELRFGSDTPFKVDPIPVTMSVAPKANMGKLMGTVSGTKCDGTDVMIPGAQVQVKNSAGKRFDLYTGADGRYQYWFVKGKYTIIVHKDGWSAESRVVTVKQGQLNPADFVLDKLGC